MKPITKPAGIAPNIAAISVPDSGDEKAPPSPAKSNVKTPVKNIIEQAKKLCEEDRVFDIVGGLHLLDPSTEQLSGTLEYLKKLHPKQMHACHCTDLNSKIALSKVVNLKEVGAGLVLEYE